MKFHFPSFLLGFGSATVLITAKDTLRPVAVELASLGLHVARVGRALVLRQRERVEDLWAEVEERTRKRARRTKPKSGREPHAHAHANLH